MLTTRRFPFQSHSFAASLLVAASLLGMTVTTAGAVNTPPDKSTNSVAPHRAVYDLDLKESLSSANITDANGRMVFEVTGSKCEGYLVNMRFILSVLDNKGITNVTDVRSSSWEDGSAEQFRFNTSQYFNQKLSKTTVGNAKRKEQGEGISVSVDSPKKTKANFTQKTYFPTEHTILVIEEALKGKRIVNAPIYDGSENGNTLYNTTAIIGKKVAADEFVNTSKVKNIEALKDMASWPVAIAFFDTRKGDKQDLLPDYEISFRLFANGVSRKLLVDYGDFSLNGKLKEIEFLPETQCD
ncbi:MAG: ATP-binding protein [Rhodomicrobium sp.]|nr:MAG: ATP-binding protein [Rhodomicrobium sp.]